MPMIKGFGILNSSKRSSIRMALHYLSLLTNLVASVNDDCMSALNALVTHAETLTTSYTKLLLISAMSLMNTAFERLANILRQLSK